MKIEDMKFNRLTIDFENYHQEVYADAKLSMAPFMMEHGEEFHKLQFQVRLSEKVVADLLQDIQRNVIQLETEIGKKYE